MLDVSKIFFICLIASGFFTSSISAQEKLRADLIPLGLRPRNEAPIPVEARFKWDSTRLLEGRLDMEFHEGQRLLGHYRSGEITLSGGEQKFRLLLPACVAPFSDGQVEVRMKFVTSSDNIELDPSILSMPTASERAFVVGWFDAAYAAGRESLGIEQKFSLEKFAPTDDQSMQRLLLTSIARRTAEDLPVQPLGYTCFDVVMLSAEAFKGAHERQLVALARWVRGGGSVCVFVDGGLEAHHIAFLNQLADSATNGPMFMADSAGKLLSTSKEILQLRSGVGRSVIVTTKNLEDPRLEKTWRAAVAFLWKLRSEQAKSLVNTGHWNIAGADVADANGQRAQTYRNNYGYQMPFSLAVQPSGLGAELLNLLMPHTVRLIPFAALIGMLALFLLMIGPADYFLLGFLKRRKFTWILFPVTSVAFMVATVMMANHYLGLRDQRRALTVVDLAADGTALRWSRYELVFAARDKTAVNELHDALWTPLDARAVPEYLNGQNFPPGAYPPRNMNYNYSYNGVAHNRYNGEDESESPIPTYDGAVPVRFQARTPLRQWRPEVSRTFSMEVPPVPLPPDWPAIEAAGTNLTKLRTVLSAKYPVYNVRLINRSTIPESLSGLLPAPFLQELSAGEANGLMSVVSQVSPTGGGSFEDVKAMDLDAGDSAVVIVTPLGEDIVVYRRFFYGNSH